MTKHSPLPDPAPTAIAATKARALRALVAVAVALIAFGCRHDLSTRAPVVEVPAYQCTGDVVVYGDAAAAPALALTGYAGFGTKPPPVVRFDNTQASGPVELYSVTSTSGTWVSENVPRPVTGSYLIKLGAPDRNLAGNLLTVGFANPAAIAGVYVAFDTRAQSLPAWLGPAGLGFEPVGTATDPDAFLRVTSKERSVQQRFRLYKLNRPVPATLALLGNKHEPGVWGGGTAGLQYLVFVRPKPVPNPATKLKVGSHKVEFCDDPSNPQTPGATPVVADAEFLRAERAKWLKEHPSWAQAEADGLLGLDISLVGCPLVPDPANPGSPKICRTYGSEGSGLVIGNFPHKVTSWIRDSEASLTSASNAAVAAGGGTPSTSQLSGNLSFRVAVDGRIEIGEMSLFGTPFTLDGASVSEVSFRQYQTLWAECAGGAVLANALCSDYEFPPGTFLLAGGADISGSDLSIVFENEQTVYLSIDHNQNLFQLSGGSLGGSFDVGGEHITVVLTLIGRFDNFAPIASLEEMSTRFPCTDLRKGTVTLDGRASHDISGALAAYTWIEDAGLPSQRILGTTDTLQTDLNFGEHRITLQVEDSSGGLASTETVVTVYDDQLDFWQAPPDVAVASQGGSTAVALGSAGASDACSGVVGISNDAPATFPDGLTLVSWTFDDYLGNVAHHVQKVFVVPPAAYPPPRSWAWGWLEVPVGGPQVLFYGTTAQGVPVQAHEYLLLLTPSGETVSFDGSDQVTAPGVLVPRSEAPGRFGLQDTWGMLWLDPFDGEFAEQGLYVFSHVLVRPFGDPTDPEDILALEWWPFVHGTLP